MKKAWLRGVGLAVVAVGSLTGCARQVPVEVGVTERKEQFQQNSEEKDEPILSQEFRHIH